MISLPRMFQRTAQRQLLSRQTWVLLVFCMMLAVSSQGQMPYVHDPSTVIRAGGQYYVFTTGRGAPILTSTDSYTWTRAGSVFERIPDDVLAGAPGNSGTDVWAPDIIKVNNQYLLYYAVSKWGSFVSAVGLVTSPTLDSHDPAYKWTDRGIVVQSVLGEELNAIDPGVMRAPDGSLWLSYGSYHGTIQLVELDPKTGQRLHPDIKPSLISSQSESSDIIAHNGYFFLFVNHGSCCQGINSAYNLRVGRSRTVTGPYLDKHGRNMLGEGGGSLFLAGSDHRIGPGHFGRVIEDDPEAMPAERFSMHYEADLESGGRATLDIRPLLWSADNWPVAGDHLKPGGNYVLRSALSEQLLEEHVDLPPQPRRPRPPEAGAPATPPPAPAPPPPPAAPFVPKPTVLRMGESMARADESWTITPVSAGYVTIVNTMTRDALEVAAQSGSSGTVRFAPATGTDNQIWQLDQLPDATYRIRNKATRLTLTAPAHGSSETNVPLATPFANDDLHKWLVVTP